MNQKTFDMMRCSITKRTSTKDVVFKSDCKHMLLVASSHKLEGYAGASSETRFVVTSWHNGSIEKTNIAALARKLEGNTSPAEEILHPSACIIEGGLMQKLNNDKLNFEELSHQLFCSVLKTSEGSDRIDAVFDIYTQTSIEDIGRSLRGSKENIRFDNILPHHRIQQWRHLLRCAVSKMKLSTLITEQ